MKAISYILYNFVLHCQLHCWLCSQAFVLVVLGASKNGGSYIFGASKNFTEVMQVDCALQVEQEEKDNDAPGDATVDEDAGPSSGAAPSSPAANGPAEGKSAAKQATEKTPKQGQAEAGAAGEGRVQGNGKTGNLTELESRATGQSTWRLLVM